MEYRKEIFLTLFSSNIVFSSILINMKILYYIEKHTCTFVIARSSLAPIRLDAITVGQNFSRIRGRRNEQLIQIGRS